MVDKKFLPIKVVVPRKQDLKPRPPGGSNEVKSFGDVTIEVRQVLLDRFINFKRVLDTQYNNYPNVPFVGKVKLKEAALAKSHRPTKLFSDKSCPIIGGGRFGELLIECTPGGLESLAIEIETTNNEKLLANISAIENISLLGGDDIWISDQDKEEVLKRIMKGEPIKVELYNFSKEIFNKAVVAAFYDLIKEVDGLEIDGELDYSDTLRVFKVKIEDIASLKFLESFRGVKKLSFFPEYQLITPQLKAVDKNFSVEIVTPVEGFEYPVIGLVDSGIAKDHPILADWIYDREEYVVDEERDYSHGSFVGGLLVFGDYLLEGKPGPFHGAKVVDVIAIPNDDPRKGPVGSLDEFDLITILKEVVPKYRDKVRVWNLSLGLDGICKLDGFSHLAIAFDDIQTKYDVIFVVAAGNYHQLRSWPVIQPVCDDDKITVPADSVRALTVGSLAHRDSSTSVVAKDRPSPFSRRGPGPNYMIKPELVHYGGNLDTDGKCDDLGVVSFRPDGTLCESVGTSFSTPRVSGLLARVCSSLKVSPSSNLAKALLIHSTRQQDVPYIPKEDEINYYGFGCPASLESILTCAESSATLIYEGELLQRRYIEIPDFPYPNSLMRDDKWYGEIWMTLVYDPPLNSQYGQEYCRANIDVHLGTYSFIVKNGKQSLDFKRQVPPEYKLGAKYEKELIEHGFKWAPVKLFHRKIKGGIKGNPWRLTLDLLARSNEFLDHPQRFALIITIKDDKGNDIYSEIVRELNQRFIHQDLELRDQIRTTLHM